MPPLGYDVPPGGRRLVINESEADQVREIYALYLEHCSIMRVLRVVQERGWHNKAWTTQKGKPWGGKPFSKSSLSRILTNILYTGRIAYQGEIIHGEHEPIIATEVWDEVKTRSPPRTAAVGMTTASGASRCSKSLLVCSHCDCGMVYTWTKRKPSKERRLRGSTATTPAIRRELGSAPPCPTCRPRIPSD